MAYHVEKTFNNGYRCCCHRTWESDEWLEDRAAALAEVPREHKHSDGELEKIEVRDGTTGEVIAQGQLEWCGGRGYMYNHYRWSGYIDDEPFEDIHGAKPGETWVMLASRVRKEIAEAKLKEAEAKLKAAEQEADYLRKEAAKLNK